MTLKQRGYLTVQDDSGDEAVFEFNRGLEISGELQKQFIMSNRGQIIQEVYQQLIDDEDASAPELEGRSRRKGFSIDGGGGVWSQTITFQTGLESEDIMWGDGSSNDQLDASGPDVDPTRRRDIIEDWLARSRTDSQRLAKWYYGEWTDGRFEGTAGAFNQPMFVSVDEFNMQSPEIDQNVNSFEGNITISRVQPFPEDIPGTINDAVDRVSDALGGITPW